MRHGSIQVPRWSVCLCTCMLAMMTACTVVKHRPGVSRVEDGPYQRYYNASPEDVLLAAEDVYIEFELMTTASQKYRVVARTSAGATIEVAVRPAGALTRTRVSVLPGYDESLSLAILDGIGERIAGE